MIADRPPDEGGKVVELEVAKKKETNIYVMPMDVI